MEKTPRPTRKRGEKTKIPLCSFFPYSSGPTCQIIKLGTSPRLHFVVRTFSAGMQEGKKRPPLPPSPSCRALLCLCGLAVCKIQWIRLRGHDKSIHRPTFFCLCSRRKKAAVFFSVPSSDNFSTSPLFLRLQGRATCIVRNIRC